MLLYFYYFSSRKIVKHKTKTKRLFSLKIQMKFKNLFVVDLDSSCQ